MVETAVILMVPITGVILGLIGYSQGCKVERMILQSLNREAEVIKILDKIILSILCGISKEELAKALKDNLYVWTSLPEYTRKLIKAFVNDETN